MSKMKYDPPYPLGLVRCLHDCEGQFTAGNTYMVCALYYNGTNWRAQILCEDKGDPNGWNADKFERIYGISEYTSDMPSLDEVEIQKTMLDQLD